MLPSNVSETDRGFTLVEQIVIIVLLGIFAVISVPNVWGMYNRAKVKDAMDKMRITLQQAQREAIRQGRSCQLNLPSTGTNNPTIAVSCTSNLTLNEITIVHSYPTSSNSINFNYKGNTNTLGTIVLYIPGVNYKKCIVISNGIGTIRYGDYNEEDMTLVKASSCITTQ